MSENMNRTVLVTGSSRGLGRAMALGFADGQHNVAVHYVNSSGPAEEVVAAIEAAGGTAAAFQADVSNSESCVALIKAVQDKFGGLDILVNNAGITNDGLAMRMKEEQWQSVIDTNLSSAFHLSKASLRGMLKSKWGRIINIASVVGIVGNAGQLNYVSAKAGLIGFSKALAQEVAKKGLTVNSVAPGFIRSDMTSELPEELKESYISRIPVGRFGEAEEVAHLVYFLASDRAAYINGQTITVDGGMVMQ